MGAPETIRAPDLTALKARQQETWSAGDYAVVGTTLQLVGELLCEAVDLVPGSRVLDVAAGNGNATLAAARRACDVVSTDYVPALLARGAARAAAEGLDVRFEPADAEALPYADSSFDYVLSTFGVMFTANHVRAAAELKRVTRTGGRIGLANWTPESFIGELFALVGRYAAPNGAPSPLEWGRAARLSELFGGCDVALERRNHVFRYRSPQHWLETFRAYYGPTHKLFGALEPGRQEALASDIVRLIGARNRGGGAMIVGSEYLEAVITVR